MEENKEVKKIDEKEQVKVDKKEPVKEEKNSEKTDDKKVKYYESQAKWIFIIMGVLIIGIVVSIWLTGEEQKFEYIGLDWERELFAGEIPIYTTQIRGHNPNGIPINFKANFRNNPKELKVPIQGDLSIIANRPVYFSLDMDSNLNQCGTVSLIGFGRFMAEMRFELITGINTPEKADEFSRPYVDCTTHPGRTTFIFTSGNKSLIRQDSENENCYILEVKDCEDVQVLEKLQIGILSLFTNQPL